MDTNLLNTLRHSVTSRCLYSSNGVLFFRKGPRGSGTPLRDTDLPSAWLFSHSLIKYGEFPSLTLRELVEAVEYLEETGKRQETLEAEDIGELLSQLVETAEREGYFRVTETGTVDRVPGSEQNYSDKYMDWIRTAVSDHVSEQVKEGGAKLKVDDKLLTARMNILISDKRNEYLRKIRSEYRYTPAKNSEKTLDEHLDRLVIAWTRNTDPFTVRMNRLGVKQAMWQVKRKFYDMPVTEHIALFLYGPQGCGKSTAMTRLWSHLPDHFIQHAQLEQLNDRGMISIIRASPVLIVDEAEITRTSINKLKNFITENSALNRGIYQGMAGKEYNMTTLMATTNHPLREIIPDSTGVRRFYSVDVLQNVKMDFETVDSLPYREMFQLIDENDSVPPVSRDPELGFKFRLEQQRKHLRRSTIEVMIDELLRFSELPVDKRNAVSSKPGFYSKFNDIVEAGLIEKLKNPEEWKPEWDIDKEVVWEAYHGQGRHQGYHRARNGWDKERDHGTFQRVFYDVLRNRFGTPVLYDESTPDF